ncbi:uncharacterized protein SAPINGB_P000630 [Magnusiomyces paraingens]|uniref:Phosphatidate cytidylyltransferase n=1 Tax=Magnusiomyces paraingens TaxID=2606893 RepID=A0A5E8B1L6_9ASCO|nr:uncharacterized protein SAPINGB_P000630 [Saprochaete ingens]VVT45078.1 unnamed protein product [Saprochaete ingens]
MSDTNNNNNNIPNRQSTTASSAQAANASVSEKSIPLESSSSSSPQINLQSKESTIELTESNELNQKNTQDAPDTITITVAAAEKEKKRQNFVVRTIWTIVMIAGFFLILAAGHIWIIALIVLIQVLTFKEVINLATEPSREKKLPWVRSLNWYFLATTIYFLEGESVIYYFKHVVLVDAYLLPLATHHRFFSYCLYIIGFIFFVSSLEKNHYRFQFTQFCITHMTLLLVVIQAHFIVRNIFSGIFWFFVPAALVITNDIFAYLCGITFGHTPLIKISPKKTVEGFIGAWICTIFMGLILVFILGRFKYFICPISDLGINAFTGIDCTPNAVFFPSAHRIPSLFQPLFFGMDTVVFPTIYIHVTALATFASLIAPFGGFFASGLKRTFKVKDFGDTIPGHGGITDRMDCQFLMGFFSYLYYDTFVASHNVSITSLLQSAIVNLSHDQQTQLALALVRYLVSKNILAESAIASIENSVI